jgi:hypothetical protein
LGRDPRQARQAVQPLLDAFRRLMLTDAECIHRLGANTDFFKRSWGQIRADIDRCVAVSGDWGEDVPVLDLGGALRGRGFLQVGGALRRELTELVELLEHYPGAALHVAAAGAQVAHARRPAGRLAKEEAEHQVRDYLTTHPAAKSPEVARALGCSEGMVRGTAAWKRYREATEGKRQRGPRGKRVGLEVALERTALERHRAGTRSDQDGGDDPEPAQLLGELIEAQRRDRAADERRPRRRRPG